MAAQKEMDERAKKLREQRFQLSKDEIQFEIDEMKWALERLRVSTDRNISIEVYGRIKHIWTNGNYTWRGEDIHLDWGKNKYTYTKKEIIWLEYNLAFLLTQKYNDAPFENKQKIVDEIPSNLKGHYILLPTLLAHYNGTSTEDKKKQIDEIFNEVLSKLTLKEDQEANLMTSIVEKLKTDIVTFKEVLKTEVDTPQKNGWCESPNPMETALQLHNAVYQLLDKEIDIVKKYLAIFSFHREATGSFHGPVIEALLYSMIVGMVLAAFIVFVAAPWLAMTLPILLPPVVLGSIFLLTGASSFAIQAYHNFPLSGGDMVTRGKPVYDDLKTLAHEMENQYSTFGDFFQEGPVKSEEDVKQILANENNDGEMKLIV